MSDDVMMTSSTWVCPNPVWHSYIGRYGYQNDPYHLGNLFPVTSGRYPLKASGSKLTNDIFFYFSFLNLNELSDSFPSNDVIFRTGESPKIGFRSNVDQQKKLFFFFLIFLLARIRLLFLAWGGTRSDIVYDLAVKVGCVFPNWVV